ncbi:SDR family NAD(P)-dependent oxidoreductase [Nonomuraea sp. NPDC004580]|uniref:SDR family NAD(P)-dependent oxidoreductase n=1 Tax=Nonomuraea sp. NPDC004580 TaxID=3154552 RepID=UPI0033B42853
MRSNEEFVAIIGIGCRLPGARGPEEFWRLLRDGRDAIGEVPADRWDAGAYYDPTPATPGRINNRLGGFIDGVDEFDAEFFRHSPREAARTDPQQRVLLEVAWEALEDAGLPAHLLAGSRTGVFAGVHFSDYECMESADSHDNDLYSMRGTARSVIAGRLSHALALQGPSMVIDAACCSSLVALHLACQSIRRGEADLALAAGANVLLDPGISVSFSRGNMLAPDGRCKAFDASANGFVRSDGFGVVVLKPLTAALADGDRVYAVVRGGAVNNDGQTGASAGTPSQSGQEQVLRAAYADAGLTPDRVHYVEAHGTGTAVGDPVELSAIAAVLAAGRPADRPVKVGSVKTNIGHTEGTAGIAGVIKAALSLHHRTLPPSLHCAEPTPAFAWDRHAVRVQRELEPWPDDAPAAVGVSSFGITGTNAHVVLEAAPAAATEPEPALGPSRGLLLALSTRSKQALADAAGAYEELLARPDGPAALDVCRAAATRRSHEPHRLVVHAGSAAELREALTAFKEGRAKAGTVTGRVPARPGKVAFVFPGQGSEWPGMGAELLASEPVFRAAIERCDAAVRRWSGWSVLELLSGPPERMTALPIDVVQPVLFSVQVALAALWRSWGIVPDTVIGHSMGELAAACAAGRLSLDDGARVICARSRLMATTAGRGGMAVVGLAHEEARALVEPYAGQVSVAALNGPSTTVVSGDRAAIDKIVGELEGGEVFCRRIDIDVAAHSPHMDALRDLLRTEIAGVGGEAAADGPAFHSTADPEAERLDAAYWVRNLREPVRFWPAVERLVAEGHDTFVEISPHPVVLGAIGRGIEADLLLLPSMRRDESVEVALGSLAHLYVAGHEPDWPALFPGRGAHVDLPRYPWQHTSFPWKDSATAGRPRHGTAGHPLLGARMQLAAHPGTEFWESWQDVRTTPYLAEHRVDDMAVFPAAGYAEMALAASGGEPVELTGLIFAAALTLPDQRTTQVQLALAGTGEQRAFQIYSDQGDGAWTLHAKGRLRPAPATEPAVRASAVPEGCTVIGADDFYRECAARGLRYGPRFQRIQRVHRAPVGSEAWAELSGFGTVTSPGDPHVVHPAILDACLQTVLATLPEGTDTYLPVGLTRLRLHGAPADGCLAHASLSADGRADLKVWNPDGTLVLEVDGLAMRRLGGTDDATGKMTEARYEIAWQPLPAPPREETTRRLLLLDAPGGTLHETLTARGHTCVRVHPGQAYERVAPDHYVIDPAAPADFARLLTDTAADFDLDGVIHAWALLPGDTGRMGEQDRAPYTGAATAQDAATSDADVLAGALALACGGALHLVQALAGTSTRLWIVTTGAVAVRQGELPDIVPASLWGFGRTVAHEHPELRCTLVDLEQGRPDALADELAAEDEDQVAWRHGERYAARMRRLPYPVQDDDETVRGAELLRGGGRFRLEMPAPGPLDRLRLTPAEAEPPAPGEVEVEVAVAALNFKDVLRAMGVLPAATTAALPLGIECAGRVTALGPGVEGLSVGQRVVAITDSSRGCVASHVHADARVVVPLPGTLSFEDAVTAPIVFLTAYFGLERLAGMGAGDRVLIHSASGGVGLAAVQLARAAGAEVFATAGSEEKRAYLRDELGIEHVMDSRSVDFAAHVRELTGGEGVDIVLNSLSGDAIEAGLGALRPGGRFVELGKRDIEENTQLGLAHFGRGLSFCSLDVEALFLHRPEQVGAALRGLMGRLADGRLSPLPREVHPVRAAGAAFRRLARARHVGKVLVSMEPEPSGDLPVRADGSYLVTGGLGALGLGTARALAREGAGHLILLGRRAPSQETAAELDALRAAGTAVTVVRADVARHADLARAVTSALAGAPPLRGVVHAAGVLADRTLAQLTWEDFTTVLGPKALGSWNLHRLAAGAPLDFFVLFSSVAALLGNPGQANYAAGNTAMDALAHHRRAHGMPATTINWGPWSDIGLAARPDRGGRLEDRGLPSCTPDEGFDALLRELAAGGPAQVAITRFEPGRWAELLPSAGRGSLLRDLLAVPDDSGADRAGQDGKGLKDELLAAAPDRRAGLLVEHVTRQIAKITRTDPALLDAEASATSLGVDSLMAMELRQAIESSTGVVVSTARLLGGATIVEIARYVESGLTEAHAPAQAAESGGAEARTPAQAARPVTVPELRPEQVDELSDGDLDAVLGQLLAGGESTA